jgi:DNA-binding transcriptional LysR family regulator
LFGESVKLASSNQYRIYNIAAPESFTNYILCPVLSKQIRISREVHYNLIAEKSKPIAKMVASGETDIGFAFLRPQYNNPGVCYQQVTSEKMYLACNASAYPAETISLSMLKPEKEVFMSWCEDIMHWHNSVWGTGNAPFISTANMQYRETLLSECACWSFCAGSIAKSYAGNPKIRIIKPDFPIPDWAAYMIYRKENCGEIKKLTEALSKEIQNYTESL